ncbi:MULTISPECIES: anhydro-N-acetylmuramic acid kinase [Brevibacillus]|jgi:anhydro-N-acetylmuramic acid kinase|uniref:anhydro-N-acetylmuramic acid kinase n=1 Tax=Brevibacillus TaxID=55080 RepID=UPI00039A33DA|nr:anhydro-N-acetylmuramic acid kinase [Brevibacillus borstelensis]KKX55588.1 anhydro-N-acetylmuramic acid kinase [Brevibacillus borstelensis cifa_chp40]MBE5397023.1 anhydro-N-acetylmuramic acid kinase [Brevibacillus borstelensis]MCC0563361.1 anhydro-N-acetylmuramic acid kinase [Brevibacillus borstelensis]MCM3471372.1 anhydro-N-acetylmuramic acid kinase [Brevibacillus borstelensis]MCM3558631.1 anhydro-N-acetylmuramic acid kinase [Brevibacillus borstelensis]
MNQTPRLQDYRSRKKHALIGLMSGTSLDGVDAALVEILTDDREEIESVRLQKFHYLPYSDELREWVKSLCSVDTARLDKLTAVHYGLAEWYAHAVRELLKKADLSPEAIDAVCVHGQTVWHIDRPVPFPGPEGMTNVRASLQIGELSTLAERTGIPVVGNFRARDLAAGGVGAPLVPYADYVLFRHSEKGRLLQNIGGIANVTVLPAGAAIQEVTAFDTGPGNMVIDEIIQLLTDGKLRYDESGAMAAGGTVSSELLSGLLSDPYYRLAPPKSTGREVYGKAFAARLCSDARALGLSAEDIAATATALTAASIADAYRHFVFPHARVHEVIVSGGGAHNKTLLRMLRDELPDGIALTTAQAYGVPDDAKEAIAFAVLGHETLMGRPSNVPSVTGAKRAVPLGNICLY